MKKTTTILSTKKASARSIIQKLCPMRSRGLAALAATFGLVLASGHASAAGANWNDSAGGNYWFTAANWTPNGVPTSATSVVSIDFTGTGQYADIYSGTAAAGDLVVGNVSAGTLSFAASGGNGQGATPGLGGNGGTLNVTHTVTLGLTSSGNGSIYVFNGTAGGTAGDSVMSVGGLFSIGGNSTPGGGSGTLTIDASSAVSTSTAIVNANDGLVLDAQASQTATVTVTGNQASLNVLANSVSTNALVLGNSATGSGTNSVTFTDGSGTGTNKNTITGNIILGNGGSSATATNTLTVTNGATLTQASSSGFVALTVGNNDRGTDTLTVTNGATLNASNVAFAQIGNGAGTTGTVNVTNGGTLSVFFTIVGDNGTGNLNINTGGTFNTDGIAVGLESTGTGTGTVTIISGGTLASGGGSYIGDGGTGTVNVGTGTTALTDHGTFNAANLFVGDDSTGTLNGEGARSLTTVTGTLSVGQDDDDALAPAGNGTVALSQGATLNVNTTGNVEVGVNGSLGPVIVAGTGLITLTTGATLNALTTGALSATGTGTFTIGHDLNQVTPSTVTGTVIVGDLTATISAMGTSPTATATLNVDSLVVGASGLGELIVAGAGGTTPATVNVGTGNVTMGTGTTYVSAFDTTYFGLGTITITEGGVLDANAAGAAGTGTFLVGNNGTSTGVDIYTSFANFNVVNVGLGSTDKATLDADKLDVGDTSGGVVNVNGATAKVNVGTGNLTVGDTGNGQGAVLVYNGGTVNANSTTATAGVTVVGNSAGSVGAIILGNDSFTSEDSVGAGTLTADTLIVGNAGIGYLEVTESGTATVTNPGNAADGMIIGEESTGQGSAVIQLDGTLTVTRGDLLIGNVNGSQGKLFVGDGGMANVDAGNLHVGSTSGGLGELEVDDGGTLNVGSTGHIQDLDVDNGFVQEIDPSIINVTGNVNVAAGNTYYGGGDSVLNLGTPIGAPTSFTNFNNAGTLYITDDGSAPPTIFTPSSTTFTINGNYVGQGGTIQFITLLNNGAPAVTGVLVINGTTSGNSLVHINSAIGSTGGQTSGNGIQIESSPNGGNNGAFALDSRVVAGNYDYSLLQIDAGADAGLYLQSHVSPEVVGATSVEAAQQYLELASLDTLVQREGELEASYQAETTASWNDPKDPKAMTPQAVTSPYKTSEVWTRGVYRNDDVHTSVGLHQDSSVGQIGADYQFRGLAGGNDRLYVGALADYGQSSGHTSIDNVAIDGSDVGFGAYATYLNGGFYTDAVLKGNISHEKVKTQYGNFGASGSGVSASLESGYAFNVGGGVKVEPQAQFVYEYESYNNPTDDVGRTYDFNDPDFLQARLGVRIDKSFEYSPGLHLTPYVRVNGLEQILGDNKVTVDGTTFTEDIGGASVAVDGGVTADVCKNVALYINGNSAWGEKDDSYGVTGGVKVSW